jgi:hypothetical protein
MGVDPSEIVSRNISDQDIGHDPMISRAIPAVDRSKPSDLVRTRHGPNRTGRGGRTAIEEEGSDYIEAAEQWIDANPDRWKAWIPREPVTAAEAAS